ncbi:MAG TPA: lysylphosphatidylglycerol synthase transmembrane domain-containing protein [Blastocatellia bacterium]|nr:lysylphosphatidylglycerol synthase transmembrane domain-containing protein [Blastocatellia bacterium]
MVPTRKAERLTSQADGPKTHPGVNLRGLAQLVIGVVALGLVLIKSDASALIEAMKHTRTSYLPLAVAASFAVTWLMAYRWGTILAARGLRFQTRQLFVYYLIGIFFTSFVPGGGVSGDVARLIYVDREVRDKALVLSTLVYERLIGVFTLLLLGFGATLATRVYSQTDRVIYIGEAVLAISFAAITILMSSFITSRLARLLRAAGARVKAVRLAEAAARTLEDISRLRRDPRLLVRTLSISLVIRIVWSLGCYVIVWAMGLPIGVFTLFAFISLVDLVRLMPISVGGLGVREWIVIALFATVGIPREQSLTFSFLAFAPIYLNAAVGGIIYVSTARLRARGQSGGVESPG